jgi:hypothetical protein
MNRKNIMENIYHYATIKALEELKEKVLPMILTFMKRIL